MKNRIRKLFCFGLSLTLACSLLLQPVSVEAKSKTKNKTQKDVVIVIDPGHDTTHLGCQYAGMDEGILDYYIACYCVKELQSYSGLQVYMTRNTTACAYGANPNSTSSCLTGRVDFATSLKADAFISIHNDYDGDATVSGCKVICQNANYKKDLSDKGHKLSEYILSELTQTGLTINNWKYDPNGTGIVTRNSSKDTYPDGSIKDYYAVLNKTKEAGIPGVIIEHAFMSNTSDRTSYLSTPEQLQKLGVADATAIAKYYGLKKK